ncbi:MAG: IS110 family transposase, partial [Actinomycetota bacterium]|nr:IS110 family transposase [Actinomycetota bacterium]
MAGLTWLTERLTPHAGTLAVAEATAMSWLSLGVAVQGAGCELGLIEVRHSARLRSAVAGRNKTDVIYADMLATCAELFGLAPYTLPSANQLALRRAVTRRHRGVVEAMVGTVVCGRRPTGPSPTCGGRPRAPMPWSEPLSRWPHLEAR